MSEETCMRFDGGSQEAKRPHQKSTPFSIMLNAIHALIPVETF
jgi:hypothetical protein